MFNLHYRYKWWSTSIVTLADLISFKALVLADFQLKGWILTACQCHSIANAYTGYLRYLVRGGMQTLSVESTPGQHCHKFRISNQRIHQKIAKLIHWSTSSSTSRHAGLVTLLDHHHQIRKPTSEILSYAGTSLDFQSNSKGNWLQIVVMQTRLFWNCANWNDFII